MVDVGVPLNPKPSMLLKGGADLRHRRNRCHADDCLWLHHSVDGDGPRCSGCRVQGSGLRFRAGDGSGSLFGAFLRMILVF